MTRANTSELGLGTTTPVGIFQEGSSPYGVLDLSGNVWEWTNSWYSEEQKYRVLRGGSWDDNSWFARCAFRDLNNPVDRYDFIGFRIVVSLAFR